jgi:hypothetical protein
LSSQEINTRKKKWKSRRPKRGWVARLQFVSMPEGNLMRQFVEFDSVSPKRHCRPGMNVAKRQHSQEPDKKCDNEDDHHDSGFADKHLFHSQIPPQNLVCIATQSSLLATLGLTAQIALSPMQVIKVVCR